MDRREYQRQWYQKNKAQHLARTKQKRDELYEWFRQYKATLKCEQCGFDHPAALDFHHVDSDQKEAEITRMVASKVSKKKILAEIAKCKILCANCHRVLHYELSHL